MFKLHLNNEIDSRKKELDGILLRNCNWSVKTAGPSPFDNERTELFLLGCRKAIEGNPCKGCFNSSTWDNSKAEWSHDIDLMAKHINNNAPHKYITIGGGEPTDQIDNLILLCKKLKEFGFHIMIYTWRSLNSMLEGDSQGVHIKNICSKTKELLKYIDIVVDGEFKEEERLWDGDKKDGLISSVGSGNQIIWDIRNKIGYHMRSLNGISIDKESNNLIYDIKINNKINLNY